MSPSRIRRAPRRHPAARFPAAAIALVFLAGAAGCRMLLPTTPPATGEAQSDCKRPRFPYQDGWLGGDSAYSVPLPGGRTLWLFGDTFVSEPGRPDRVGSKLVHNSIGISRCEPQGFSIRYLWTRGEQPRAFIADERPDHFYWLFGGVMVDERLFISLVEVERTKPRGPMHFPFRFTRAELLQVERPQAPPEQWRPRQLPWLDDEEAFPGALVVDGEHLYFFAFFDRDGADHPRFLARLPLSALRTRGVALANQVETYGRDGRWVAGFEPQRARILMSDTATEMSVHFDEDTSRWVAIYSHPNATGRFPSDPESGAIRMRTASRLEGPWSAPRTIHRVAELAGGPARDPTICYGAKAHPQYETAGEVPITYTCNLYTPEGADPWAMLRRLLTRMDLYRPQTVLLPMPE